MTGVQTCALPIYAVVLDDSRLESSRQMSVKDRLERMIYLADEREVKAKYVRGNKII